MNGHRRNGTFAPGNKAAAGRNTRTAHREAFNRACTAEDMEGIVRKAVIQALAGDAVARAWLGQYALQKPARLVDMRVTDGDESEGPDGNIWDYDCGVNPVYDKYR